MNSISPWVDVSGRIEPKRNEKAREKKKNFSIHFPYKNVASLFLLSGFFCFFFFSLSVAFAVVFRLFCFAFKHFSFYRWNSYATSKTFQRETKKTPNPSRRRHKRQHLCIFILCQGICSLPLLILCIVWFGIYNELIASNLFFRISPSDHILIKCDAIKWILKKWIFWGFKWMRPHALCVWHELCIPVMLKFVIFTLLISVRAQWCGHKTLVFNISKLLRRKFWFLLCSCHIICHII